jgi:hypothetical protein
MGSSEASEHDLNPRTDALGAKSSNARPILNKVTNGCNQFIRCPIRNLLGSLKRCQAIQLCRPSLFGRYGRHSLAKPTGYEFTERMLH